MAQLFQNMWNPSTPGTLRDMKNKFKKIIGQVYPQWKGDDLQDAFEFLVILLDTLSEELDLRATKPTQYRHALVWKAVWLHYKIFIPLVHMTLVKKFGIS